MTSHTDLRVGIDIGGTFTDIVLSAADGTLHLSKVASTPDDPGRAVIDGLHDLLARLRIDVNRVAEIVHGTTVGSNTILARSGAKTGLITTRGFRDILEIGRIRMPIMFDLSWEKPEPLVERHYRREANERIGADGGIVTALDPTEIEAIGRAFATERVESVAVCFINSYVNPSHEKIAADTLRRVFPQFRVTASHEVLPEIKEYERTSTTVVNAYLLPRMQAYLERLSLRLAEQGVKAPLQVMASNGGIFGAKMAERLPVFAVASGPAGGVTGSTALVRDMPGSDFIIFDMGGTTAKASIIENGQPALVTEYEFRDGMSSPSRFVKGGGYMLKVPAIDIAEVGAGGGSLVRIDEGGLLHVGPASAGANPGPACYGLGNLCPTVTDANMTLGYLNPVSLAGGTLRVEQSLSDSAIDQFVAKPLGIARLEAAHGIRQIANVNMARAIRSVTVERGKDPRDMTMIAFGGNGPLHGVDVARLLGIKRMISPILSGVFAAAGMLSADVEHNFVHASARKLSDVTTKWLSDHVAELERQGRETLAQEGYDKASSHFAFFADLRYVGQSSELSISFDHAQLDTALAQFGDRFRKEHEATYGYSTGEPVELANIRLTAIGRSDHRLRFTNASIQHEKDFGYAEKRSASLTREDGFRGIPLLDRKTVGNAPASGPAIIESYDTTILVPDGCRYRADAIGNIIVDIDA